MILIAEDINVMSQTLGLAMKERQTQPIQNMVKVAQQAGMHYIDLNIGPAKKLGAEMMPWLVQTVQQVSDLPLSLDTTNPEAIEAGLKLCKRRALINSVSLQPERLEHILPLISRYNAEMIGLLWSADGMPRDVNERCMLAVDLVYKANEAGVPNEDIWLDPIATPISGDISKIKSCLEFLQMLPEIAPGCKSIVGLSNVSNGTPTPLRPYLNRVFMVMLKRAGIYSVIADAQDAELPLINCGERNELVNLIHRALDGEVLDIKSLSEEEFKYVKTAKVLNGEALYSHAWLEG
ncbi:MAG: dihydropteroate synthase [Dehalococcoidia bacterium]|nr:dihydropteroate synthase [Dehalococcoidia bacterium]